jgi:hypothetical protein
MDKIIRRVTVVHVSGDKRDSQVVYKKKRSAGGRTSRRTSPLLRPIERVVRHFLKAGAVGGEEAYNRHIRKKRRNGWLLGAPSIILKANRKAYNEARKGVPLRILPRAN